MVNQILNGPYAQAIAAAESGGEVLLKGKCLQVAGTGFQRLACHLL